MTQSFKASELTRAIRAARAAGLEDFEVSIDDRGLPVIRVGRVQKTKADFNAELDAELEAWLEANDRPAAIRAGLEKAL